VFLLADAGYDTYSTTIETSWRLVEDNPDLVQRFIDASIEDWYSYLYGDPTPANALIKAGSGRRAGGRGRPESNVCSAPSHMRKLRPGG
jgi:hypothetical protein